MDIEIEKRFECIEREIEHFNNWKRLLDSKVTEMNNDIKKIWRLLSKK